MHCPHCGKSVWFKLETKDNGITVVMPYTPEQIADRIIKQKEAEKNGKV